MNERPLVIIGCGSAKASEPRKARELYQGGYFKACLAAALAFTSEDRVLILSGRHGFLRLDDEVQPYDQRVVDEGHVSDGKLVMQAEELGVAGSPRVIILAGKAYATAARKVWPRAEWPLQGVGIIGKQLAFLKKLREEAASC